MKLTKKLLPLAFVATTAAAIVPMTVSCSCSKNKGEIKVDDLQDFFEKGTYTRQTEAIAKQEVKVNQETLKSEEATTAYFDALASNPKYLADDIWDFLAKIDSYENAEPFKLPFKVKGSLAIAANSSKDKKTIDLKLNCDVTISDIDVTEIPEQYKFLKELELKAKGSIWLNSFKAGVGLDAIHSTETKKVLGLYLDYTTGTETTPSSFWSDKAWEIGADLSINVGGYDDAGASGSFNITLNSESDLVKMAYKMGLDEIDDVFGYAFLPLGTLDNFTVKAA